MKVLHTISGIWINTGGPAESVPLLCSSLVENKNEVTIATLKGNLSLEAIECKKKGVNLRLYSHVKSCSLSIGLAIFRLSFRMNLIHNHGLWQPTNWFAGLIAKYTQKPLVVSPRGCLEPLRLNHSRWKKKITSFLIDDHYLKYSSCIHVCSELEYQSVRLYGLKNPVAIIPNAVRYSPSDDEKLYYRNNFFLRYPNLENKKILLFLSRLSWEKGLPFLAETLEAVSDKFSDWHLLISGSGIESYEVEIKSIFNKKNLANQVSWTGHVSGNEKLEVLSAANLFILPTHSENFGIAVAEALSFGIPVITTHGAPWGDLLKYKCGWWVRLEKNNLVIALLEALQLSDKQLAIMGENGRKLIASKYTWEKAGGAMSEVYHWIIHGGNAPDSIKFYNAEEYQSFLKEIKK